MESLTNHLEYQADECAFCGAIDNLITVPIHEDEPGDTKLIICSSCDFFKFDFPIKVWLRYLRNQGRWRWHTIVLWQKGQQTKLAELVRQVREEPEPMGRAGAPYHNVLAYSPALRRTYP